MILNDRAFRWLAGIGIAVFTIALLRAMPANAADDDDFYRGKQIRLIVGSGTGGVYDVYARMLAPFLGTHIPGSPKIIVENMEGASSMKSAGYMFNIAPRDGTVIAMPLTSIVTAKLLLPAGANFDPVKFSWIGSVTRDPFVGYVWYTSPIQTLQDLKTKEAVMGADALGSAAADIGVVAKTFFGLKLKLVMGYPNSPAVKLAMEKGEIEGTFANALGDLKTQRPEWIRDKKVRIIVQHGLERSPELPDVPMLMDLAQTESDRESLTLLLARQDVAKPVYAPPDIPPARLATLRRAFDATMVDPAFLEAARQARVPVDGPKTGEQLADLVAQMEATPPAAAQRILDAFANYK